MIRDCLIVAAVFAAIATPVAGIAAFDRSETTLRYSAGHTFSGYPAIFEHEDGRLFSDTSGENVGHFGGGRPRVVAFGCDGSDGVLIAMEESDLPACKRVEPIQHSGPPAAQWSR